MVKCNSFTPPPPSLLAELSTLFTPPPGPPPTTTPRTDAPDTPFPFLALPRELRDQVYTHAFHPHGIHYRDRTNAIMPWTEPRSPASHIDILLTCQQFHTEALPAFYRTRTLEFSPRPAHHSRHHVNNLSLSHVLRSFPFTPAAFVSYVNIEFYNFTRYPHVAPGGDLLFTMWEHVVCDAHVLKAHFPRLRRFEARYHVLEEKLGYAFFAREDDFHALDEVERRERSEQVAARVVEWLERMLGGRGIVPPEWLRLVFCSGLDAGGPHVRFLQFQEEVFELAHRMYAQERGVTVQMREDSGRVWLERLSGERKRGRKGWYEQVSAV